MIKYTNYYFQSDFTKKKYNYDVNFYMLISLMSEKVKSNILTMVKDVKYYFIILDCTLLIVAIENKCQ
jgi:hypothetical protein